MSGTAITGGGTIVNPSGTLITGSDGIVVAGFPGFVSNYGSITGTGEFGAGVLSYSGGSVTNAGFIGGNGAGILIGIQAEAITNTGLIAGLVAPGSHYAGYGIGLDPSGGSHDNIDNGGTIAGQSGIYLFGAGSATIYNEAGALIEAGFSNPGTYEQSYGIRQEGTYGTSFPETPSSYGTLSVINAGTIISTGSPVPFMGFGHTAVDLLQGSVTNMSAGLISGYITGVEGYAGFVGISSAVSIDNAGRIIATGSAGTAISLGNGTVLNTGTVQGGAEGEAIWASGALVVQNAGTIMGGIEFGSGASRLVLEDGSDITGSISAAATAGNVLELTAGFGSFNMGGTVSGFQTIQFDTSTVWTLAGTTEELAGGETITGFNLGDTLVLEGFSGTDNSYTSGTGLVIGSETLNITGPFTTGDLTVSTDGTDTTITTDTAACFCPGTRIRTSRGEVPIEHLREGDLVETLHHGLAPVRWIGHRAYDGRFIAGKHLMLPITVRANAIAGGIPARDLVVSPGHALYAGGFLIPAWRLVNGITITQAEAVEQVEYFHIELDEHRILFAEGCPAESYYDDGGRAQFSNAANAPVHPSTTPLPRCESGLGLESARTRIATRAGIAPIPQAAGPLHGYIDTAGPDFCAGWAQDIFAPETPVVLGVLVDGICIAQILANEYRPDLRAAYLGSGCHGFRFTLPVPGNAEIRRAADGAPLALGSATQAA